MSMRLRPSRAASPRTRLGITGLAAVFIMVLLASVILPTTGGPLASSPQAVDPLETLGIAPSAPPAPALPQ